MSSVTVNAYKLTPNQAYLTLSGVEQAGTTPQPLHIIAVIDVSGSMEEQNRLENVKRSLQFMFPMLNPRDLVSIVTFSNESRIVCQAVPMNPEGIAAVEHHLLRIAALGGTNLGAGILSAMDICASSSNSHKPCVILLTDGEVNVGMKESPQLLRLLSTFHRAYPTLSLYSVGYGLQHNTALLSSMATEVSGAYSIVQNLEQVATVFGDMLGGLTSLVAQNVEVIIHSHGKVESKFRTTSSAANMHIHIGDLYAGSEQSLIVEDYEEIVVRYLDSVTGAMALADVVHHRETDSSVQNKATGFRLRLATSDLMTKIAQGTVVLSEVTELLARLELERANHSWIPAMIHELEGTANQLRHGGLSRQTTAAAANQSAWLAMGRGVTMMTQEASDGYADVFSTPAQRMVSGGLSRAVSGPAPDVHPVGGSPPVGRALPDLNSLPPFPIPPPPIDRPILRRQMAVADGYSPFGTTEIPPSLAPIPLTRETGAIIGADNVARVLRFSGLMEDEASSYEQSQPDSP